MSIKTEYMQEVAKSFNQNDINNGMMIDDESVEKITQADIGEVFEGGFISLDDTEIGSVSYLESMPNVLGGSIDYDEIGEMKNGKWVSIGSEFRKVSGCNKTGITMRGVISDNTYIKFIKCFRWMCAKCGSKGGRINMKRFSRIIGRVLKDILKISSQKKFDKNIKLWDVCFDLRQFVFTVPKDLRKYFLSKKGMTALCRMAERIIKKEFPGLPSIRYFHPFGTKQRGEFNPHVNIHSFEIQKEILTLTPEKLKSIKIRWGWAIMAYLRQVEGIILPKEYFENVDIHYSFVESDKAYKRRVWNKEGSHYEMVDIPGMNLLIHRIEYMSRPCPGYEDLEAIKQNLDLLKLFVVDMKGYHYITNCGSWEVQDIDRKEEIKEDATLAGEPLKIDFDKDGKLKYITRGEFNLKYMPWDYEELTEGFYRIKEKELTGKKKNDKMEKHERR